MMRNIFVAQNVQWFERGAKGDSVAIFQLLSKEGEVFDRRWRSLPFLRGQPPQQKEIVKRESMRKE